MRSGARPKYSLKEFAIITFRSLSEKDQYLSVLPCSAVQILVNALRQGQSRQRKIKEPVRGDAKIHESVAGGTRPVSGLRT